MFERKPLTYEHDASAIQYVLQDSANPLRRIAEIVPENSSVLDIGAGSGLLAQVLKSRLRSLVIDGIEPNPHAAEIAKKHYRRFHVGYAQDFLEILEMKNYDYVVLADVLEHLADPLAFLQTIAAALTAQARIIISLPNVAFGSVRIALLHGAFEYVDSGLLERTHLRFFTLSTITSMVHAAGLNIDRLCFLQRDIFTTEMPVACGWMDYFCVANCRKDPLFWTYQFLLVLSRESVGTQRVVYGDVPLRPSAWRCFMRFLKLRRQGLRQTKLRSTIC